MPGGLLLDVGQHNGGFERVPRGLLLRSVGRCLGVGDAMHLSWHLLWAGVDEGRRVHRRLDDRVADVHVLVVPGQFLLARSVCDVLLPMSGRVLDGTGDVANRLLGLRHADDVVGRFHEHGVPWSVGLHHRRKLELVQGTHLHYRRLQRELVGGFFYLGPSGRAGEWHGPF